jgi:conjugative transfer region protein TrbK
VKRAVLIRLSTGIFVLVALLAALLEFSRDDEIVIRPPPARIDLPDPNRAELRRCQALGEAALDDQYCLDAWADKRRRFLDTGSARSE